MKTSSQSSFGSSTNDSNGQSTDDIHEKQPPYRILTLDGGGIRGLITAVWLNQLEKKLGTPIHEHFDLIAGTSTGSILACAIALGKPTDELVRLYKDRGKEIFPSSFSSHIWKWIRNVWSAGIDQPIHSDTGLKKVLQDEFEHHLFGELEKQTFVLSYDTLNRKAICFNSKQTRYGDIPIWEICKASSSAPAYFPAHVMTFNRTGESYEVPLIDGGVVASNPTACAIAEGLKHLRKEGKGRDIQDIVVVSLGTGDANKPIYIEQSKRWGIMKWMLSITGVMFDGVSQAMDHVARNMLCEENYFRLQAKLHQDSLDDVSDENLNAMHAFAEAQFNQFSLEGNIEKIKEKLMVNEKNLSQSDQQKDLAARHPQLFEINGKSEHTLPKMEIVN